MSRTGISLIYSEKEEVEEELDVPISEASMSDLEEALENSGKVLEDELQELARSFGERRELPFLRWDISLWGESQWT